MMETLVAGAFVTPSIRLIRKLRGGGMGTLWVAFHEGLRIDIVVKFISADRFDSAEATARFEREAALAALAKSPHVVQLFDYGISQTGMPYITMELLEGEDLGSRIARERRIAPCVLAGWLTQIGKGLARVHEKGIVHRDIKPENIFLCHDDAGTLVKVLDFGIAKDTRPPGEPVATLTSALLGTPCYMSPEQITGARDIDFRSDLWALGVLVYYALTGVRPFDQSSLAALVASITKLPIAPASSHNPALSGAIDRWIGKALMRAPDARFSSAFELAESFALAVSAEGDAPASFNHDIGPASLTNTATEGTSLPTTREAIDAGWTKRRARLLIGGMALTILALAFALARGAFRASTPEAGADGQHALTAEALRASAESIPLSMSAPPSMATPSSMETRAPITAPSTLTDPSPREAPLPAASAVVSRISLRHRTSSTVVTAASAADSGGRPPREPTVRFKDPMEMPLQ